MDFESMKKNVCLASASPRRLALLQQLGLDVQKLVVEIDETPLADEPADVYVVRMAKEKLQAALMYAKETGVDLSHVPVLAADTTVALDGEIFGKPTNEVDAAKMLGCLSGKVHQVMSAVAIFHQGEYLQMMQNSDVHFKTLEEDEILRYIATGEPLDKAGAYGIQGLGGLFVTHLSGSFTGVMGLPLFETAQLLKQCGIDLP